MKKSLNSFLPHIIAILIFIIISSVYFPSMFEGKVLNQTDILGYKGSAKEITDYREETHEEPLWTNSMFGGMPAYLINMRQPNNILTKVNRIFSFHKGRPAIHIFLYMFGFYILLLLFGVNPWLGIVGGIAYGFSSYLFIILEPGHITKAIALGYMPMIIGSVYYSFRKNFIIGATLMSIFLGLQLVANHLQITYYTLLILLIFGIFEIVNVIRNNSYNHFIKTIGALIIAVILSISLNITNLWSVSDYSKYSMRGPSELTSNNEDKTGGLDISYATNWSYGLGETFNLLIPNFKGGASNILLADKESETFKFLSKTNGQQQAVQIINQNAYFFTQYWGGQPGTSGPVYIGAVIVFLFVFGMFFIKGPHKWWLFTVVVVSILLSWGRNFESLTHLFLNYFPGYNKFRTVSMILVMAELAMPLLAILAVNKFLFEKYDKKDFLKSIKYSFIIVGGLTLLFSLFPGISNLSSPKDGILIDQGAGDLVNALIEDRTALLRKDAFRSLIFISLTGGLLYAFYLKKVKQTLIYIGLGLLILIDLWPINKRYLNDENFVKENVSEVYLQANAADIEILKDKDLYYRVLDLSQGNPLSSARASYFHKSLGGYHGAKMGRYQEIFENHLSQKMDPDILDMFNTKYIIQRDQSTGQFIKLQRDTNLGNAWFISDFQIVDNADEEIKAIGEFSPSTEVIIDKRFINFIENVKFQGDSLSSIKLTKYAPNRLEYSYSTKESQIAVFSDIYYGKGWKAYLNGEEAPYFRVNYILRSMVIPPGKGDIVFEFKPKSFFIGTKIALIGSIIIILLSIGIIANKFGLLKKVVGK